MVVSLENAPVYLDNGKRLLRVVNIHDKQFLVEDVKYPKAPLRWMTAKELGDKGFRPTGRKSSQRAA